MREKLPDILFDVQWIEIALWQWLALLALLLVAFIGGYVVAWFANGDRRDAELVGQDVDSDLAVLQVCRTALRTRERFLRLDGEFVHLHGPNSVHPGRRVKEARSTFLRRGWLQPWGFRGMKSVVRSRRTSRIAPFSVLSSLLSSLPLICTLILEPTRYSRGGSCCFS